MRVLYVLLSLTFLCFSLNAQNCLNSTIVTEDVLCNGDSDGTVDIIPINGVEPFSYSLDGGPLTPLTAPITGLAAGCYTVVVTDGVGCSGTDSFCINEPTPFTVAVNVFDQLCWATCDGGAEIIVTGGTAPYAFIWPTGSTSAIEFGLCSGFYEITVTDANGCTETAQFIITEPPPMDVFIQQINGTCLGSSTGSAVATVTGGWAPYFFAWDNGETGATATGLTVGIHTITVTDANGCSVFGTVDIIELPLLDFNLETSDETCLGQDGSATAEGVAGTPPFEYHWSTGATGSTITGLSAGSYAVSIIDANGCVGDTLFTIAGAITINVSTTQTSCNTNDGTATATVIDGSDNPAFSWSNGQTGPTATGLAPGGYSVTVTDQVTQCTSHTNAYVEEDPACVVVISGYVYLDAENEDCVVDTTTIPLANHLVDIEPGGMTFTDANGYYEFVIEEGTYDLSAVAQGFETILCPASNLITVAAPTPGNSYPGNDFYFTLEDVTDLCVSYCSGPARPGFTQWNYLWYCNYGSSPASGSVTLTHDSLVTWGGSNGAPDSYDPDTYTATWNFTDLQPYECVSITYNLNIPVGTPLGTLLESSVTINPIVGDTNPGNNHKEWNTVVTGAYDPNDKRNFSGVNPFGGDIKPTDSLFQYMIRFQNTGTDTAFTVILKDTLDSKLDMESFTAIGSSHDYSLTVEDENVIVVTYENIMLPDSNVNEPASHGFFRFDIKWKEQPDFGTQFFNQAAIYFDFNPPVLTNIVENVVEIPVGVEQLVLPELSFAVAPNPFDERIVMELESERGIRARINLYNSNGVLLKSVPEFELNEGSTQLTMSTRDLASGIYFVSVVTDGEIITRKVVKM